MTTNESQLETFMPLVVTPIPEKGESVLGFILRTAAANGYRNANKILRYAGMTDNEARSARPPLVKLARLYGQPADVLRSHGLDDTPEKYSGRHVPLLGHQIHSIFTRCKQTGICVECIREHGYIEAYQELKYAVACPRHAIKTLYQCPACKQDLNWLRPDLALCRCGEDLMYSKTATVADKTVLALLGVLHAKLLNQPLDEITLTQHGFPVKALQVISLNTLLSVIYRFGLFNNTEIDMDMAAVETTAKAFSD